MTTNIRIRQNLFYDISRTSWSGNGWFMLIGDGPTQILVDHNTIDHDGTSVIYAYGGTATAPAIVPGFQFTNNIARHSTYGINGAFFSYGLGILNGFFPQSVVAGNLFSGGAASRYPAGNFFNADFDAQFVRSSPDDYRLSATSVLLGRATDGTDVGADVMTILTQTSQISGAPSMPRGLRIATR